MRRNNHKTLPSLKDTYDRTRNKYPGMNCAAVVVTIFKETKMDWAYEEIRNMTGYSYFTIAGAVGALKRMGMRVERTWDTDKRTHFYRMWAPRGSWKMAMAAVMA